MPTWTLNIPTAAQATRVIDALCGNYAYQATLPNGSANPETRQQFAQRQVREFMRANVRGWEADVARKTASDKADSEIQVT